MIPACNICELLNFYYLCTFISISYCTTFHKTFRVDTFFLVGRGGGRKTFILSFLEYDY